MSPLALLLASAPASMPVVADRALWSLDPRARHRALAVERELLGDLALAPRPTSTPGSRPPSTDPTPVPRPEAPAATRLPPPPATLGTAAPAGSDHPGVAPEEVSPELAPDLRLYGIDPDEPSTARPRPSTDQAGRSIPDLLARWRSLRGSRNPVSPDATIDRSAGEDADPTAMLGSGSAEVRSEDSSAWRPLATGRVERIAWRSWIRTDAGTRLVVLLSGNRGELALAPSSRIFLAPDAIEVVAGLVRVTTGAGAPHSLTVRTPRGRLTATPGSVVEVRPEGFRRIEGSVDRAGSAADPR